MNLGQAVNGSTKRIDSALCPHSRPVPLHYEPPVVPIKRVMLPNGQRLRQPRGELPAEGTEMRDAYEFALRYGPVCNSEIAAGCNIQARCVNGWMSALVARGLAEVAGAKGSQVWTGLPPPKQTTERNHENQ